MRKPSSQWIRIGTVAAAATAAAFVPSAAFAADPGYAGWNGGNGNYGMSSPAAGFPGADLTTNGSPVMIRSGQSIWMGEDTPFGAAFGSSRNQGYMGIGTTSNNSPSTTTLTFDAATPPADWGFALGDIDVDMVQISGTDSSGNALTAADLGYQSSFNLCQNSPRPAGCNSAATDQPTWNAATMSLTGQNTGDTVGATGWFQPTASIASLTFTFTDFTGMPMFQFWVAAEAYEVVTPLKPILISAPSEPGDPTDPDTIGSCDDMFGEVSLELLDTEGAPVIVDGAPVVASLSEDDTFTFDQVFPGSYQVQILSDAHFPVDGATVQPIEVTDGDTTGPSFSVECVSDSAQPDPTDEPADDEDEAHRPRLPVTGPGAGLWIAALLAVAGGALAIRTARNH
ncbi:hypothetical protein [Glycomyces dulcitolivorans]|uniref:hypothetical protein n=1 Tax=Glycomyces dulcitolivorans TaxID=2200759 RepID=UPI000DD33327|nr:hypothetical protein [Glycomyces dulcitolivorans]